MTKFKIYLYYFLGSLFIILALLGAILPIVPTTPFLLLALYFLNDASPSLHSKILKLPVFGPILRNWNEHKVIRKRAKIQVYILLAISAGYIWYFKSKINIYLRVTMTVVLLILSIFVFKQKSEK